MLQGWKPLGLQAHLDKAWGVGRGPIPMCLQIPQKAEGTPNCSIHLSLS